MAKKPKAKLKSDALLTLAQVAAIEHSHIVTMQKRAREGKLPGSVKCGRAWMVNKAVYEKHLNYPAGTLPIPTPTAE